MNKLLTISLSKNMSLMTIVLLFLFSHSSVLLAGVWDKWDSHVDEYQENDGVEEYVWKEGSNQLPPYPDDDDLLEVAGPPAYQNFQYFIDGKNLIVGADGVIRYSIVIRSKSGADNVMFDGIRCSQEQIKNYAYGSTDMEGKKKFIAKTNALWKPFRATGSMAYGSILAVNYFCGFNAVSLTRGQIIQNIKYGKGDVDGLYN